MRKKTKIACKLTNKTRQATTRRREVMPTATTTMMTRRTRQSSALFVKFRVISAYFLIRYVKCLFYCVNFMYSSRLPVFFVAVTKTIRPAVQNVFLLPPPFIFVSYVFPPQTKRFFEYIYFILYTTPPFLVLEIVLVFFRVPIFFLK